MGHETGPFRIECDGIEAWGFAFPDGPIAVAWPAEGEMLGQKVTIYENAGDVLHSAEYEYSHCEIEWGKSP